jgi:hypothetical protein
LEDNFFNELEQRGAWRQWKFYLPAAHDRAEGRIEFHNHNNDLTTILFYPSRKILDCQSRGPGFNRSIIA